MRKEIILLCKRVIYFSPTDEEFFFEWITSIKSIIKVDGIRDELYLHIKNRSISDKDLRELLALFYRYKVDMKQLKVFLNPKNKEWFYGSPKGYWYRRVFGQ